VARPGSTPHPVGRKVAEEVVYAFGWITARLRLHGADEQEENWQLCERCFHNSAFKLGFPIWHPWELIICPDARLRAFFSRLSVPTTPICS
jgi:hypothetical protein